MDSICGCCQEVSDSEYLSRPLIPDVAYTVTEDCIKADSPSTQFVGVNNVAPAKEYTRLIDLYTDVISAAKAAGVKVGYTRHLRKVLEQNYLSYACMANQHRALFAKAAEALEIVQHRGIHYGYSDDRALNQYLETYVYPLKKTFYGDTPYSRVCEAEDTLQHILAMIRSGNVTEVYI